MAALSKSGLMNNFPEMPDVLDYFSATSNWLKAVLGGLGNFEDINSVNFNFRLTSIKLHNRIMDRLKLSVQDD